MKNILFITDIFSHGGLETRITEQANFYHSRDILPFLMCETFESDNRISPFHHLEQSVTFTPHNNSLTVADIQRATEQIVSFCKKQHIDYIECQPFWCLIPATIAAQKLNIPISYTIHGSASGNFLDYQRQEAQLLFYLFLKLGLNQIIAVSPYLASIYNYLSNQIYVSPNGIDISNYCPCSTIPKNGNFALASRIDHPKTDAILNFLPILYNNRQVKHLDIYGDGNDIDLIKTYILDNHYHDKITLCGWTNDLISTLKNNKYDCVFGVGRVIADAIAASIPAGILGYGGFAGIINHQNFKSFFDLNFISWDTMPNNTLADSLTRLYQNPSDYFFSKKDLQPFSSAAIWASHLDMIKTLHSTPKSNFSQLINILLSHPQENILTGTALLDEIYSLFRNNLGDNLLVYSSFLNFLSTKNLSQSEKISSLQAELSSLKNSLSWKITKPLRSSKKAIKSLKRR